MKPDFDYREVPRGFAHCFRDACPQSEHCLRHIAATHSSTGESYLSIVNPGHLPKDASACTFYRTDERIRVAWGVKHLFDRLPLLQAENIKRTLLGYYGKTHYYRLYRKEYHLLPQEQDYIRGVYLRYGIQDEPAYEYYTEIHTW